MGYNPDYPVLPPNEKGQSRNHSCAGVYVCVCVHVRVCVCLFQSHPRGQKIPVQTGNQGARVMPPLLATVAKFLEDLARLSSPASPPPILPLPLALSIMNLF